MNKILVPFGKYAGHSIDRLRRDKEYSAWLLQQPWFRERFPRIHIMLADEFAEANDSPLHNAMQARFLDRQYAFSAACSACRVVGFNEWYRLSVKPLSDAGQIKREASSFDLEFEVRGWDVFVSAHYSAFGVSSSNNNDWYVSAFIELKPTIGEDFPNVLRQVKSRRENGCVVVDAFMAESVSFEHVQEMFSRSKVPLLRSSDIGIQEIPSVFRGTGE